MRSMHRTGIVVATLLAVFAYQHAVVGGAPAPPAAPLRTLPTTMGPWQGVTGSLPPEILSALRPDDYLVRWYRAIGPDARNVAVGVYVAQWLHPALNERIHSPAACLPGGGWLPLETGQERIAVPGTPSDGLGVNRYLIQQGPQRQLVLYWFQGRGRTVANEGQATLLLAYDTLRGRGSDETLVRISAPVIGPVQATEAAEVRFIQRFYPELLRVLAGKGGRS